MEAFNAYSPFRSKSDNRFEYLKDLWPEYVQMPTGHWKGEVYATVPSDLADDVEECMGNNGAIVDERTDLGDGTVYLYSRGYWAHGF